MGTFLEIALRVQAEIEARQKTQARGITVADVLRVFPGVRVVSDLTCLHCGGKLIERVERRRHVLGCGRCGRKK